MAFCFVLKKTVGEICILPRGQCMWQDRITNACRYDPKIAPFLTTQQYCELVHQVMPSEEELEEHKQKLLNEVKKE